MTEWLSYRPRDLLLFTPETYFRQFELLHEQWFPLQLLAAALICTLGWIGASAARRGKPLLALLSICWIWSSWAFLHTRYASINWTAEWFAWLFYIQAILLISTATFLAPTTRALPPRLRRAGLFLFVYSVVVHPLAGVLLGRNWSELELFGFTPDATAIGSLGLLIAAGERRFLLVIPLIWCGWSAMTLLTMGSPEAWLLLAAAIASLVIPYLAGRIAASPRDQRA